MTRAPRGSLLASNRSATHEYSIVESFEAGIELQGSEVKSLRAGLVQLREGYVRIERGEAWLLGVTISQYAQGSAFNPEQSRRRRLLLHKREIQYLDSKVRTAGLTIVPLRMYLERNHVKVAIALVRGKKLWDKRADVAKRDAQREMDRAAARTLRDA